MGHFNFGSYDNQGKFLSGIWKSASKAHLQKICPSAKKCSGDKPHKCELCTKKFALACNLRAHMKTHEANTQNESCSCNNNSGESCEKCEEPDDSRRNSIDECSENQTEDSNCSPD